MFTRDTFHSPFSRLHCLWPLQLRKPISCWCIELRALRSRVLTAFISCRNSKDKMWTSALQTLENLRKALPPVDKGMHCKICCWIILQILLLKYSCLPLHMFLCKQHTWYGSVLRSKYSMKPVANSQNRKLCVSLMVLRHQYVLLLALVHAQNGPTKGERAGGEDGRSRFRKQELFINVWLFFNRICSVKTAPGV